jgi:peptidoglycan/xylan/chitin deacetylase (PgdA/CDA1 family)
MRGHIYCSPRCARDDGRLALWLPVKRMLARPVPPRLAMFAVGLGVAAPMLLALRTVGELDRLSVQALAPAPRRAPGARIETVVREGARARVEGTGPAAGAVFLFGPSGFAGTAPVVAGRFRFDGVAGTGPWRVGVLPLSAEVGPPAEAPAPPTSSAAASASRASAVPAVESAPAPRPETPVAAIPSAPAAPLLARAPGVPDLTRGPDDRPEVVLSFDAGSSDRGALQILDALRARGVRTTIFLTGEFIRRYPAIARRVADDGHEVGNHTDSHPHLTTYAQDGRQATRPGVDRAYLSRQLAATAAAFRAATGRSLAPLWRAPYGEQNAEIRRWAAREGYWHVGWTGGRAGLDGLDWVSDPASRSYRTAGAVVGRLVARAESGGIILLHLGSDREDPVAPRVPELLDGLGRRGFRLARASEFLDRLGRTADRLASLAAPSSGGRGAD